MTTTLNQVVATVAVLLSAAIGSSAHADVITDWNSKANDIVVESKMGTPPANRVMAIVQTAVLEAVNLAQKRQGHIDAAVAAANRATMLKLMPAQEASINAAYSAALGKIADNTVRSTGVQAGEEAANAVLAARADDGAATPERYKPHTTAGAYVPTAGVAVPQWPQRKTWLLKSAAQLRPAAPPALSSAQWARDYNEVKAMGGKTSARRTPEQTEVARFWDYSLPPIYHGVLRSVALQPDRDVARNARLFAAASQAMDDALIAVFDAKYAYNFWRPVTAIRNAEIDGNDATEAEAGWAPLIDNPMHPEYASGHSILAGALGAVLKAEFPRMPELSTSSPTAKGATRRWQSVDEMVQEISNARIWGGLHYRFSTDVAAAMGQQIGEMAAAKYLPQP